MPDEGNIVYWFGDSLYLNITNKCSNSCIFCFRNFSKGVGSFNLRLKEEPDVTTIISELKEKMNLKNWDEVVFCGFGEPTECLDVIIEVTKWIRKHYGKPLLIRINTNGHGYLLNKDRNVIIELKKAGVDKVSVSLNTQTKEIYNSICRPQFENAYDSIITFIERAKEHLEVEVTAVALPAVNLLEIKKKSEMMKVGFRAREYFPCCW